MYKRKIIFAHLKTCKNKENFGNFFQTFGKNTKNKREKCFSFLFSLKKAFLLFFKQFLKINNIFFKSFFRLSISPFIFSPIDPNKINFLLFSELLSRTNLSRYSAQTRRCSSTCNRIRVQKCVGWM